MAVRRDYIADQYRNLLGREGSEGEIAGWENAPDEQSVYNMFIGSPEYTSRNGGQATWQDIGGQITPTRQPQAQPNVGNSAAQGGYDDPSFPGGGTIYPVDGGGAGDGTRIGRAHV